MWDMTYSDGKEEAYVAYPQQYGSQIHRHAGLAAAAGRRLRENARAL